MQKLPVVTLLLLFAAPAAVQAQQERFNTQEHHWALVSSQLRASLETGVEAVKTQSLKNAIVFATLYRDKIQMAEHVRILRGVYEKSSSRTNQQLALAALFAVGNGRASYFLSGNVTDVELDAGRLVVASVLNEYYQSRSSIGSL